MTRDDPSRAAPTAADPHLRAAAVLLSRLADTFPEAGLGITGSVAAGTHRPDSDLDVVVVDGGFRREMQFATECEGVRAAILCLRPEFTPERERRWARASGGDARLVSMVRMTRVERDPRGWLAGMQEVIRRLEDVRVARREALLGELRGSAEALIHGLWSGSGRDEHLQMQLLTALVDAWHLREGLVIRTRADGEEVFARIAARDPDLHALLRAAVPLTPSSMPHLLRAFDRVFRDPPDPV